MSIDHNLYIAETNAKSLGNVIKPQTIINQKGAEILRLWVAMVNYREDMRLGDEILDRVTESYRKIRNTLRYLMSNINDFVPAEMSVDYKDMALVDQWAMEKLNLLIEDVHQAYDSFGFHRAASAASSYQGLPRCAP